METNSGKLRKTVTIAGIEALFSEFEALYGVRFADMWRGTDIAYVKSLWAKALSGLSVREVRTGLDQCRFKPWPPSLPEFLVLCSPPPDPEKAFVAAQDLVCRRQSGRMSGRTRRFTGRLWSSGFLICGQCPGNWQKIAGAGYGWKNRLWKPFCLRFRRRL